MLSPRAVASLVVLSVFLSGCALTRVVRSPDPIDPVLELQRVHEQHLEIHRLHHRMAMEAHEAALRLHEQMASPPPPPPTVP